MCGIFSILNNSFDKENIEKLLKEVLIEVLNPV